jgi:hypothetical protein
VILGCVVLVTVHWKLWNVRENLPRAYEVIVGGVGLHSIGSHFPEAMRPVWDFLQVPKDKLR